MAYMLRGLCPTAGWLEGIKSISLSQKALLMSLWSVDYDKQRSYIRLSWHVAAWIDRVQYVRPYALLGPSITPTVT